MQKSKKTAYFYVGIVILVLMFGMCIFQVHSYNTQIDMYVASYGYDEAYVKEMVPFFSTMLPEFSSIITSYGLFALISFGINSILNALKNDAYMIDDFDVEEFLESVSDADGDGKSVFEEIKEETKEVLDKAEEKLEEVKDDIEDKIEEVKKDIND